MGLDVYLQKGEDEVSIDDEQYPDHLLKIGYFRSSYNQNGLNSVLRRYSLPDLTDIFEPGDRGEFAPDWEACLVKATDTLERLKEAVEALPFTITTIGANPFTGDVGPRNDGEALKVFGEERAKRKARPGGSEAYSNRSGLFLHNGESLVAAIPGVGYLGHPTTYLIFPVEEGWGEWYCQAMEIVIRTMEYVLAQPDLEAYTLYWSG